MRRTLVHGAIIGWGAAQIAAAQVSSPPTGSLLNDPAAAITSRNIADADKAHQAMNDYAVCLVKTNPIGVRKAVRNGSDAEVGAALGRLSTDSCLMDGMLRMPQTLLRGAVYRALYLRDFIRAPAIVSSVKPDGVDDDPLRAFGFCVNTLDGVNTRTFVMATPATSVEKAALSALTPALSRCVSPNNRIRFTRAVLQGTLAEAAYRQASASTVVTN